MEAEEDSSTNCVADTPLDCSPSPPSLNPLVATLVRHSNTKSEILGSRGKERDTGVAFDGGVRGIDDTPKDLGDV